MPQRPDNAFVIGAMKAGTTSLFLMLKQHPCLTGSFTKEPDTLMDPNCDTDAKFLAAFPGLKPHHKYVLDASTSYSKKTALSGVPERIAALKGKTKLIYILRNPFDRVRSHYYHTLKHRPELIAKDRQSVLTYCLDASRYSQQLLAYSKVGLTKHMLFLDFEELAADPLQVYTDTLEFLELDRPEHLPSTEPKNVNETPKDQDHLLEWDRMRQLLTREQKIMREVYGFRPRTPWLLE